MEKRLRKYTLDEVYISILTGRRVSNEEGWTKIQPVGQSVQPSGSCILDAVVEALHGSRLREITAGRVAGRVGRRPQRRHPPPDGAPAGRFRRAIPPDAGKRIPPLHGAPAGRNRQTVRLRKYCRLLPHVPVADRPERGRLPARAPPCQLPRLIHVGMSPEQKKQLHLQTN